jgi:hypothetical protein
MSHQGWSAVGRTGLAAVMLVTLAGCGDATETPLVNAAEAPAADPDAAMAGMRMMPQVNHSKIPPREPGSGEFRVRPTNQTATRNDGITGQFRMTCGYSHMNFDDPIVNPGVRNATHLHVFFGNTAVDAMSTAQSIATTGNSTCAGGIANRTAYWVPAIIDTRTGTPQKPTDILVYYKSEPLPGRNAVVFPPGLRMIAGDARSRTAVPNTDWGCLTPSDQETRGTHIPRVCNAGNTIEMTIGFPSCWNGRDLDVPDHKSHMAYAVSDPTSPTGAGCPATHPVQLPTITEKIRYRVTESGSTAFWRLSSDNYPWSTPGGFSVHADWFGGWDPDIERTWVQRCLKAAMDCHGFLLGDGREIF